MSIIKNIRREKGFSQEQIAEMLGMNRITYTLSETEKRDWKEEEIEKLSQILDTPIEVLMGTMTIDGVKANQYLDKDKFENLVLYILNRVGIKPNIGKTVLYKLLYFCDFDFYELYGKSITGIDYIRLPRGPAPYSFDMLITDMAKNNKILVADQFYMGYYQKKYFPNEIIEDNVFSVDEKNVIDEVIDKISEMNASEVSDYSHGDAPRQKTKDMDIINYDLVKFREYPYSPIHRQAKKDASMAAINGNPSFDFLQSEPDLYNDL